MKWKPFIDGYEFIEKKGKVTIKSTSAPMRIIISVDANGDLPGDFDKRFEEFNNRVNAYKDLERSMLGYYRFNVKIKNDTLYVHNHALGIDVVTPLQDLNEHYDALHVLEDAQVRADEKIQRGKRLVEELVAQGVKFDSTTKPGHMNSIMAKLSHPNLKRSPIVNLTGDDKHILAQQDLVTLEHALEKVTGLKQKTFLSDDQKVTLILDTTSMKRLYEKNGNDTREWTELLNKVAYNPSVKRIIIPAMVADWELLGKIAFHDPDKNRFITSQVDTHHHSVRRPLPKTLLNILDNASRGSVDDNGNFSIAHKGVSKFVICETAEYRELRKDISRINKDHPTMSRTEKSTLLRELRGAKSWKNQGEESMLTVARALNDESAVYLITDDMEFIENRNRHYTTASGKPIGCATTYAMVKAHLAACRKHAGESAAPLFNYPQLDGLSEDDALSLIFKGKKESAYYAHSLPGRIEGTNGKTSEGKHLEDILDQGLATLVSQRVATSSVKSFQAMVNASGGQSQRAQG